MQKFEIRKDIPVPDDADRRSPWPFKDMEVGDALVLPDHKSYNKARSAAIEFKRRHKEWFNCTSRKTEEGGIIWRTKTDS